MKRFLLTACVHRPQTKQLNADCSRSTALVLFGHTAVSTAFKYLMASFCRARCLQHISATTWQASNKVLLPGTTGLYDKPRVSTYSKQAKSRGKSGTTARRYLIVHHRSQSQSLLEEAKSLILTATGEQPFDSITIGVKHEVAIRGGAVVRQGHLASIKDAVGAHAITDVILNFSTTASHLSRISQALQLVSEDKQSPVLVKDRTGIVLDIFRKHASTAEARLQVRLAELRYQASRVVRKRDHQGRMVFGIAGQEAEVVSARGRGGQGAVGGSGEKEAMVVASRSKVAIAGVVKQLQEVRRRRGLLRYQRRRDGHAVVALVGYTNAGKSTLMSALCKEDLGAADKLFATLDTKVRRAETQGQPFLLVDTVGFIQGLPLQLVAAFQATLDEALQADLVVHVIDASSPDALQQRRTVIRALTDLGMSEHTLRTRTVEVWNKFDCLMSGSEESSSRAGSEGDSAKMFAEAAFSTSEGQMQIWQLVMSYLYSASPRHRRRQESTEQDEPPNRHQLSQPKDMTSDSLAPISKEHSIQYNKRRPAAQKTGASSASRLQHSLEPCDLSSEYGSSSSDMETVQSAFRGYEKSFEQIKMKDIEELRGAGEQIESMYAATCESTDSGDTAEESYGSESDDSDIDDMALPTTSRRQGKKDASHKWISDCAVVITAKEGLGLPRLIEIITEKLRQSECSDCAVVSFSANTHA